MNRIEAQNDPVESASPAPGVLPLDPSSARYASSGEIVKLNFSAEQLHSSNQKSSNSQLVKTLSGSATFREFQRAFEDATLLPLTLRAVESWQLAHTESQRLNGFCALLSQTSHSCAGCLRMQQRVCEGANGGSRTMSCSFGLKETAVGVKVGKDIVAYLQTGQVFFKAPTPLQTQRALKQIKAWGLKLDEVEAARCYNETPVVAQRAYGATVRLLQFFAGQLGTMANQIVLHRPATEPVQITRARNFIEEKHREKLSLPVVARHAGMSTYHFCKTFQKFTGVKFTKYVSRIRVEEAKNLLIDLNFRLGEIGYHVGFQSLTHYNRVFRTIVGESPQEYRAHLPTAY